MLDIKTKDYDAREELLEHRRKITMVFQLVYMIMWILFIGASAFFIQNIANNDFSIIKTSTMLYLILMASITFPLFSSLIVYFMIRQKDAEDEERYYKILIFMKKQFCKEKKKK